MRHGDGAWTLNVRIVLRPTTAQLIGMTYRGLRHGPQEVLDRIARGETVRRRTIICALHPSFETASERYGWLNDIALRRVGHRLPEGPVYQVFEIL